MVNKSGKPLIQPYINLTWIFWCVCLWSLVILCTLLRVFFSLWQSGRNFLLLTNLSVYYLKNTPNNQSNYRRNSMTNLSFRKSTSWIVVSFSFSICGPSNTDEWCEAETTFMVWSVKGFISNGNNHITGSYSNIFNSNIGYVFNIVVSCPQYLIW